MITEAKTQRTVPKSKRTLMAVRDGLKEIEAYIGWFGPSTHTSEPENGSQTADEPPANDEALEGGLSEDDFDDGYESEDDISDIDGFDREEIEVAIDAFISVLLDAGAIRKSRSGKLPSFTDVFKKLFGKEHEITLKAQTFEEYVEGYFGWISWNDMREAGKAFFEIQKMVNTELEGSKDAH